MTCIIYDKGAEINRIEASEDFTKSYCAKRGYTYEILPASDPVPEETTPTLEDQQRILDALLVKRLEG